MKRQRRSDPVCCSYAINAHDHLRCISRKPSPPDALTSDGVPAVAGGGHIVKASCLARAVVMRAILRAVAHADVDLAAIRYDGHVGTHVASAPSCSLRHPPAASGSLRRVLVPVCLWNGVHERGVALFAVLAVHLEPLILLEGPQGCFGLRAEVAVRSVLRGRL